MTGERRASLTVLVFVAVGAHAALAGLPATEGVAGWRLDSPLAATAGNALWLLDRSGSWRVEIALDEQHRPDVEDLLTRRGRGWTLACAGPDAVLMQGWGEPWQEVGGSLATTVERLLSRWGGRAGAEPAGRPWRAVAPRSRSAEVFAIDRLPAAWSTAGPAPLEPGEGSELRQALASRGRGRGGPGLRIEAATPPSGGLILTSPRWPVTVHLEPPALNERPDVPAEAFVPIWSLADLGVFPAEP